MVYNSKPQQQERTKNTKVKKKENVNAITNQQGDSKGLAEYREPVDVEMNPGEPEQVIKTANTSRLDQLDLSYLAE